MNWQERCRVLEDENELLREEVRILKKEFDASGWDPDPVLGLTRKESDVLKGLMSRARMDNNQLHYFLYGTQGDSVEPKIIDVFVCKLRKKLTPHDLIIETSWGYGYSLTPESRKRLVEEYDINANFVSVEQLKENING